LLSSCCRHKSKIKNKIKVSSKTSQLALLTSRNPKHDNAKSAKKEHSASKIWILIGLLRAEYDKPHDRTPNASLPS